MDSYNESRLKFQIQRLGYLFRNLDLLQEALTHSLENSDINPDFPSKNGNNKRLCVVGETVLKLVVSEYIITNSINVFVNEGIWTIKKNTLLEVEKQAEIGKRLYDDLDKCKLFRISDADLKNRSFVVPYDKFVKAIFGAVFLDSGGFNGNGVKNCLKLFQKLWQPYLSFQKYVKVKTLKDLFPSPEPEVKLFWIEQGLLYQDYCEKLLKTLNIKKFQNNDILLEAIIHKSFYDPVANNASILNKRKPDFQRLEFLGDAVLDVVLAEFHCKHFPEFGFSDLSNTISVLAEGTLQTLIGKRLKLKTFVQIRNGQNWIRYGDIVEAIIGAIYVDTGSLNAKKFILEQWGLTDKEFSTSLLDLQCKLNYKFQNDEVLMQALTHPSFFSQPNSSQLAKRKLTEFQLLGKTVLQMLATEYAFQTVKLSAGAFGIELHEKYLSGELVLRNIGKHLNLKSFVQMSTNLKTGTGRFKRFEIFTLSLVGAIHQQLQMSQNEEQIREIFYRLWNPYLKLVPKRNFTDCFISNPLNSNLKLREKLNMNYNVDQWVRIQTSLGYTLKNINFLEQALTGKKCQANASIGDSKRFAVVGVSAIHYFATLSAVDSLVNVTEKFDEKAIMREREIIIFNASKNLFDLKLLRKQYIMPQGPLIKSVNKLNDILIKSVFGAIYLDLYENNCAVDNMKWISYLQALLSRQEMEPKQSKNSKKASKSKKPKKAIPEAIIPPACNLHQSRVEPNSNTKPVNKYFQETKMVPQKFASHEQNNYKPISAQTSSSNLSSSAISQPTKIGLPVPRKIRMHVPYLTVEEHVVSVLQKLYDFVTSREISEVCPTSMILRVYNLYELTEADFRQWSDDSLLSILDWCSTKKKEIDKLKAEREANEARLIADLYLSRQRAEETQEKILTGVSTRFIPYQNNSTGTTTTPTRYFTSPSNNLVQLQHSSSFTFAASLKSASGTTETKPETKNKSISQFSPSTSHTFSSASNNNIIPSSSFSDRPPVSRPSLPVQQTEQIEPPTGFEIVATIVLFSLCLVYFWNL